MHNVIQLVKATDFPPVERHSVSTVQVNLGYRCNQSCVHCHVGAGPHRKESMSAATIDLVLRFAAEQESRTLDLTGGAPELHPMFRDLVVRAKAQGLHIIDRCNLTVLLEPNQRDTASFLAKHEVEIIASLPCYEQTNVDRQRGKGVFEASIESLRLLNTLGYGQPDGLSLNLVFNPQGPTLPPPQAVLEQDYKRELAQRYGLKFTRLYVLANMPIQRFGSMLISKGEFRAYMQLLRSAHHPDNLESVMCKNLISIDWEGFVYDCDFNQMLGMPISNNKAKRTHLRNLLGTRFDGRKVAVG
ncbi:MAG: arsenosugar biosynthesis radical SAM (seleno)protein ArsS, partial [Quisquiliibacterium sp.]